MQYFTYWHSCGVASKKHFDSIFNCFLFVHSLVHLVHAGVYKPKKENQIALEAESNWMNALQYYNAFDTAAFIPNVTMSAVLISCNIKSLTSYGINLKVNM